MGTLKSPTKRRMGKHEDMELNLVPMLDTLVTLISFLMFSMAIMTFVAIETPVPQASPSTNQRKLKTKPLQLTISINPRNVEVWSPFGRVKTTKIPNTPDGQPDVVGLHSRLIEIKKRFPKERQVVLVPTGYTSYDKLIAVMDAARYMTKTDEPIFITNEKTGMDEQVLQLFSEIIFGNLLGG